MKVGYISKRIDENGKETFKYFEANGVRRVGVRTDNVRVKFLQIPYPYDEILDNTEFIKNGNNLILVCEPFFTDEELKERCLKWCEWASSCKHKEYSILK